MLRVVGLICLWAGCGSGGPDDDTEENAVPTWEADIQPLLSSYCGGCHGDSACSTGLCWLDGYAAVTADPAGSACETDTVAECLPVRIDAETMPPNVPCPPGDPGCITLMELDRLERWVEAGFPER
jgi:hypothetical protein